MEKEKKEEENKKEKKQRKKDHAQELKECENKYLRLLAELENTRKRMQKEKQETIGFAIENTVAEFLPLFDNFENALKFAQSSSEEVKNWATGFQMILTQFRDVLHNHGIVAFHSVGNTFDPHCHEAMEIMESNDYPEGSIIEEFAKGYKSKNRTIRPAKVKVAKKAIIQEEHTENEAESEDTKINK